MLACIPPVGRGVFYNTLVAHRMITEAARHFATPAPERFSTIEAGVRCIASYARAELRGLPFLFPAYHAVTGKIAINTFIAYDPGAGAAFRAMSFRTGSVSPALERLSANLAIGGRSLPFMYNAGFARFCFLARGVFQNTGAAKHLPAKVAFDLVTLAGEGLAAKIAGEVIRVRGPRGMNACKEIDAGLACRDEGFGDVFLDAFRA